MGLIGVRGTKRGSSDARFREGGKKKRKEKKIGRGLQDMEREIQ